MTNKFQILISEEQLKNKVISSLSELCYMAAKFASIDEEEFANKDGNRCKGLDHRGKLDYAISKSFLLTAKKLDSSELKDWVYYFNEYYSMEKSIKSKVSAGEKLYFGYHKDLMPGSMRIIVTQLNKNVGMALFVMAKNGVVNLADDYKYPVVQQGKVDYCANTLPLHFAVARAINRVDCNEKVFNSYELPITKEEVNNILTNDDKLRIPSYVTRAFVSLGMYCLEDINIELLAALHQDTIRKSRKSHFGCLRSYFKILTLVLERKGLDSKINGLKKFDHIFYDKEILEKHKDKVSYERRLTSRIVGGVEVIGDRDDSRSVIVVDGISLTLLKLNVQEETESRFYGADLLKKSLAYPHALLKRLDLDGEKIEENEQIWLTLQEAYFKVSNFESSKHFRNSIAYLNCYLFVYLKRWFRENKEAPFSYPEVPDKFRAGFFVMPIKINKDENYPKSLPDFVRSQKLTPISSQSYLRGIANFFEWISFYAKHLPGCRDFVVPMTSLDYPKASRPKKTTKGRFPKVLFPALMSYLYGLLAWVQEEINAVKNNYYSDGHMALSKKDFIDWQEGCLSEDGEWVSNYKIHPVVTIELDGVEKTVPIMRMKNIFSYDSVPVDGKMTKVIVPNHLVQIIAALETGHRHQNLQWLDRRTYKMFFAEDVDAGHGAVRLYINTDKVKEEPFVTITSSRVIDVFYCQESYLSLIDKDWLTTFFYEGNENSKWGEIACLFQRGREGNPHSDESYNRFWHELMLGFQVFLKEIGYKTKHQWAALLPSKVEYDEDFYIDNNDERVFYVYDPLTESVDDAAPFVMIKPKCKFTPHATRSTVVSNATTAYVSQEFIGANITGQNPAVVGYYAVMDSDDRDEAYKNYIKQITSYSHGGYGGEMISQPHVGYADIKIANPHVDRPESNLQKAFSKDRTQALSDFGCISLQKKLENDSETGIERAKYTDIKGMDFGKKRICSLNGQCPAEIISSVGERNCPECFYAVFAVDHLPAINKHVRDKTDDFIKLKKSLANKVFRKRFSEPELDELTEEKLRIAREISAWKSVMHALEFNRKTLMEKDTYLVGRPDLVSKKIIYIDNPDVVSESMLLRMNEAVEFPLTASQNYKGQIRKLTRRVMMHLNKVEEYESILDKDDPTQELLVVIKTYAKAVNIPVDTLISEVENSGRLPNLDRLINLPPLLPGGDE